MKILIKITLIAITCIFGFYIYLVWSPYQSLMVKPSHAFWRPRFCRMITKPLAEMGCAEAQFKLGVRWFYGSGLDEPNKKELENAIEWWEKASEKGHEKARIELAKAKDLLDALNAVSAESGGYAYWQAEVYYNRAIKFIEEDNDAGALEYTMKALLVLEKLELYDDSLYFKCLNLISAIEEIAGRKGVKE